MTIKHIAGREDWYLIITPRGDHNRPPWHSHGLSFHLGDRTEFSVEYSLFSRHGFGVGVVVGRNGAESDIGLDLHAHKLGSVWMRLQAPWTSWARISEDSGDPDWYYARHSGIRIGYAGALLRVLWDDLDGKWSRDRKRSEWSTSDLKLKVIGYNHTETVTLDSGETVVPLPEGTYPATWKSTRIVTTYTAPLGKLLDRIRGPRVHEYIDLDIAGGIPVEGKGENSWDCGMDGLFGCSGTTVTDAVGNAVKHVLSDRQRHGGPHNLTRPMTVTEAGAHG